MNDILEDQKIHYIVKDYQRMYNGYHALKDQIQELEKTINEKDKEIILLRSRVNDLKKQIDSLPSKRPKAVKGKLDNIETRTDSLMKLLEKVMSHAQKNIEDIENLRELINK